MDLEPADNLISFNEVIQRTDSPHLLLGNGFSMSYDPNRFSFTTLLESATRDGIIDSESSLYKVFKKLETSDFESVMRTLENSNSILEIYAADENLRNTLSRDSANLKEYLVQVITNNHPLKSTSLTTDEKTSCIDFLKKFKKIYTLNYDLLLYWATMQDPNKDLFKDGFGNTEDSIHEGFVVYKNSSKADMDIYYLHGAMHYFDAGDQIIKKTYVNSDINLVDQVRESLNNGIYPIFISEGDNEQKKTKILHSAYLNHCYRSLKSIGGDLVIFGASLKGNDKHIVDAILESSVKRIFLGVSNFEAGNQLSSLIADYNTDKDPKYHKEVILYDYRTVKLWK